MTVAMLLVPETLTPDERAVFVLHEAFDVEYDEIAETLGGPQGDGPADRTPRASTSGPGGHVSPSRRSGRDGSPRRSSRPRSAVTSTGVTALLAPDAVQIADGG